MKKDFTKLAAFGSRDLTPNMVQEALGVSASWVSVNKEKLRGMGYNITRKRHKPHRPHRKLKVDNTTQNVCHIIRLPDEQPVNLLGNTHNKAFEVYVVTVMGESEVTYVGHGKAGRYRHVFSGVSHVEALNELHHNKTPIMVEVIGVDTKASAESVELYMIAKMSPKTNTRLVEGNMFSF